MLAKKVGYGHRNPSVVAVITWEKQPAPSFRDGTGFKSTADIDAALTVGGCFLVGRFRFYLGGADNFIMPCRHGQPR
jgi:hypothetical protein